MERKKGKVMGKWGKEKKRKGKKRKWVAALGFGLATKMEVRDGP